MRKLFVLLFIIFLKHSILFAGIDDLEVSIEKLNDSTFQAKCNIFNISTNLRYKIRYYSHRGEVYDTLFNTWQNNTHTIEDSCKTLVHTFKINKNLENYLYVVFGGGGFFIEGFLGDGCLCNCLYCGYYCTSSHMSLNMIFNNNSDSLNTWSVRNVTWNPIDSFIGNVSWGNNTYHGPNKTVFKTIIDSIKSVTCNQSRIYASFSTVGNKFDFPAKVQLMSGNNKVGSELIIDTYNFISNAITEHTIITGYNIIDNKQRLQKIKFDSAIIIKGYANAGTDKTICKNDSVQIGTNAVSGYSYNWLPIQSINNNYISNPKVSPGQNTMYYFTASNGTCISKDTIQINVKPIPIANAGRDTVSCFSQPIKLGTLPFPNATYFWYGETSGCGFGPFEEVKAQPLTSVSTKPCNFIVSVNLNGCITRDTVNVKPIDYPDVRNSSLLQNDISLCGSQNIIGTLASPSYIQPYLNYVWTSPNGGILSDYNIATPIANTTNSNTQNTHRYIRTTSACNWSFKDSIDVTFKPLPSANFSKTQNGATVNITAPNGAASYAWNFGNGQTSSTRITSVTYTANGKYYITLLVTGNNGCTAQKIDSVTITSIVTSNISAGADQTICQGQSATLTATNGTNYTWSTNQSGASITVSPSATTTYIVTGTVNSVQQKDTVTVNVKPRTTFTNNQSICQGQTYSINGKTYSTAGTYRDTLRNANSQGCDSIIVTNLTVKTLPNVDFTKIITNNIVQFTAPNGNDNYNWTFGDGSSSLTQSPTHTYQSIGKYYIVLQSTLNGCSNSKTDSVNIVSTAIKNNISFVDKIEVFPNPTDNFISIELTAKKHSDFIIKLINAIGQVIYQSDRTYTTVIKEIIPMNKYSSGVYFLQIEAEGEQATYRILKK